MSKINATKQTKKANRNTQGAVVRIAKYNTKNQTGGGDFPKLNPSNVAEFRENIAWLICHVEDETIMRMVNRILYMAYDGDWIFKDDEIAKLAKPVIERDYPVIEYDRKLVHPYNMYLISMAKGVLQAQEDFYKKLN